MSQRFILASASETRRQLLERAGMTNFDVVPADIDETPHRDELPVSYVRRVAHTKAVVVAEKHPGRLVLAADTAVQVGRRILRKAQDAEEAYAQVSLLSGRRHMLLTAVTCVTPEGRCIHRLGKTRVAFRQTSRAERCAFVATGEWQNVAVYRLEGYVSSWIRFISGDPTVIKGLPIGKIYNIIHI